MTEYKTIRATISDSELIELVEQATYQSDVTEQDLVVEGLYYVFEDNQ